MLWARMRGAVAVLAVTGLAGCSSMDDLNPGSWAGGASDWVTGIFDDSGSPPPPDVPSAPRDEPKLGNDERPKGTPPAEQAKIADSLVADRANAQYTEAEQKREGNPTRPLTEGNASTSPDAKSEAAATPAPVPAPMKATEPVKAAEPAPAPVPEPAPAPSTKTLKSSAANADAPTRTASAAPDTDSVVAPSARVKMDESATTSPNVSKPAPTPKAAQAAPEPAPTPAPAAKQAAAQPAPAPAPAPAPQQVAAAQPAPAPVAAPAPRPRPAANGDVVGSTYRERLAEFAAGSTEATRANYAEPSSTTRRSDSVLSDSGVPNSKVTAAHGSGGAHPLSALDQNKAAASFQVAEIAFGEGTAALAPESEANLRAVADVYRDSKGVAKIGIVGHSNSPRLDVSASANREANRSLAAQRADVVARALEKMGVPSGKIYAGATGETAGDYVEVFASY